MKKWILAAVFTLAASSYAAAQQSASKTSTSKDQKAEKKGIVQKTGASKKATLQSQAEHPAKMPMPDRTVDTTAVPVFKSGQRK